MANSASCWLSMSIAPVQKFIGAARTVRDLKVGSVLLSRLSGEAIAAAGNAGGTLLFPDLGGADHIPNQFTAGFASREAAESAQVKVEAAIRSYWSDLSSAVKKELDKHWSSCKGWDEGWDAQVDHFWVLRGAIVDVADLAHWDVFFGGGAANGLTNFQKQWRLLAAALETQKQVRHFPGNIGIGRPKCTLFGELEQMGPGGPIGTHNHFWTDSPGTKRVLVRGLRLHENDRFSAVALVKRFAPAVSSDKKLEALRDSISDTGAIAMARWTESVKTKCSDKWGQFQAAYKGFRQAAGEDADTESRYLLDKKLSVDGMLKDFPDGKKQALRESAEGLVDSVRKLRDAAREAGIGPAPRYLAALKLDGDRIGAELQKCADPEALAALSASLRKFASDSSAPLNDHLAEAVYAGGDDLLALLPMDKALDCARTLRQMYPGDLKASTGVVFFHYKHDLQHALAEAEAALHRAKEAGRDAVGWTVLKRAGAPLRGEISYELAGEVQSLAEHFAAGASVRWAYHIDRLAPDVPDTAPRALVKTLVSHFIRRMEEAGETGQADRVADAAKALLDALCGHVTARHQAINAKRRPEDPPKPVSEADTGYMQAVMDQFVPLLLTAAFLARGKDDES